MVKFFCCSSARRTICAQSESHWERIDWKAERMLTRYLRWMTCGYDFQWPFIRWPFITDNRKLFCCSLASKAVERGRGTGPTRCSSDKDRVALIVYVAQMNQRAASTKAFEAHNPPLSSDVAGRTNQSRCQDHRRMSRPLLKCCAPCAFD